MSSSSEAQFPLLAWSAPVCTCGAGARCCCAAQPDATAVISAEVTTYFLAYQQSVNRYLVHKGCPKIDAEDVTQEAFIRLYRVRLKGQRIDEAGVLPWVLTVARRLAIDRLRHKQVEQAVCSELTRNLAETLPDEGQNCEHDLLERQRRAALIQGIQQLPVVDRVCLHHRAEGHSLQAIGRRVGLSESGVSRAVHRAIRRLRRYLNGVS